MVWGECYRPYTIPAMDCRGDSTRITECCPTKTVARVLRPPVEEPCNTKKDTGDAMCGDCQEGMALGKLAALTWGGSEPEEETIISPLFELLEMNPPLARLHNAQAQAHLMECITLLRTEGLDKLHRSRRAYLSSILCRLVDVLLQNGFESEEYQRLIQQPYVSAVVAEYSDALIPWCDFRLFQETPLLTGLLTKEFFLDRESCLKTLSQPQLAQESLNFLSGYVDWWHAERDDWLFHFDRVHGLFPYIAFSFVVTRMEYPTHPIFEQMLQNYRPGHFTTHIGLEMWLQRQATVQVHQAKGIDPFLPFAETTIRPVLLCYLLIKGKLDLEERQQLRESILASGKYDSERVKHSWSYEMRNMIVTAPYFLMRYL